jgi:hypothetical protein
MLKQVKEGNGYKGGGRGGGVEGGSGNKARNRVAGRYSGRRDVYGSNAESRPGSKAQIEVDCVRTVSTIGTFRCCIHEAE